MSEIREAKKKASRKSDNALSVLCAFVVLELEQKQEGKKHSRSIAIPSAASPFPVHMR